MLFQGSKNSRQAHNFSELTSSSTTNRCLHELYLCLKPKQGVSHSLSLMLSSMEEIISVQLNSLILCTKQGSYFKLYTVNSLGSCLS